MHESACDRFCCKSLFALVIKNSPGRRRDFRVSVGGTSSPDEKLTRDLARVIEAISIEGRASDCLTAGKLAPGNLGLLQQYRHVVCVPPRLTYDRSQMSGGRERGHSFWAVHDPGCVKTLRGIITPAILGSMAMRRATKPKNLSSARNYDQFRFCFHTTKAHKRH
jgi:hypothetical protein